MLELSGGLEAGEEDGGEGPAVVVSLGNHGLTSSSASGVFISLLV